MERLILGGGPLESSILYISRFPEEVTSETSSDPDAIVANKLRDQLILHEIVMMKTCLTLLSSSLTISMMSQVPAVAVDVLADVSGGERVGHAMTRVRNRFHFVVALSRSGDVPSIFLGEGEVIFSRVGELDQLSRQQPVQTDRPVLFALG